MISSLLKSSSFSVWLAVLLAITTPDGSYAAEPVDVLVNSTVVQTSLSLKELRAIYTMKKRLWNSGKPIEVFVLPESSVAHKDFCKKVLGVFPRQLKSVWYRSVYSGTGVAPTEVSSEEELIKRVSQTDGAIGYILAERSYEKTKTKIIDIIR